MGWTMGQNRILFTVLFFTEIQVIGDEFQQSVVGSYLFTCYEWSTHKYLKSLNLAIDMV
jgi:hypothetical protein